MLEIVADLKKTMRGYGVRNESQNLARNVRSLETFEQIMAEVSSRFCIAETRSPFSKPAAISSYYTVQALTR